MENNLKYWKIVLPFLVIPVGTTNGLVSRFVGHSLHLLGHTVEIYTSWT